MPGPRRRILFVAEAVTLAHLARLLALARCLDPTRYEIHFACPYSEADWLDGTSFQHWPLHCIPPDRFLESLGKGLPPYDLETLHAYVREDSKLIEAIRPALVVGDFRLSLAVSASLHSVPYANICNAYWSPYCLDTSYPLPDHPVIGLFGLPVTRAAFRLLSPFLMARHTRIYNAFRQAYRLPALPGLREIYTEADHVLYADIPSLVPTRAPPAHHHYLGPVLWSPDLRPPEWWDGLAGEACIYVTLGSSGAAHVLPDLLAALAGLPYSILLATGGRVSLPQTPPNVFSAEYLPGIEAARRSRLVICNGGSPTVYQALSAGTPVLGVPSNMDQFLCMRWVERAQAGRLLRTQHLATDRLRRLIGELLDDPLYRQNAQRLASEIRRHPFAERFAQLVGQWLSVAEPA